MPKTKEQTPKEMLWDLSKQANSLMSEVAIAEVEEMTKAREFFTLRAKITMTDEVQNLKTVAVREAEVANFMDMEPISIEYHEAKIKLAKAHKKWELFKELSANLRALVYAGKDQKNAENNTN